MNAYKPARQDKVEVTIAREGSEPVTRMATVYSVHPNGDFVLVAGRMYLQRFTAADLTGGTLSFKLLSRAGYAADQDGGDQMDRVLFAMRRALVEQRQVIDVGDFKFRFQRRNEKFEDGDNAFQALQSGVFAYFRATAGGVEVPGRWVHLGSTDDLEDLMKPYLHNMAESDLEKLHVTMSANAALQLDDRAAARRSRTPSAPAAADTLLFAQAAQVPGEFVVGQHRDATPGARRTPR